MITISLTEAEVEAVLHALEHSRRTTSSNIQQHGPHGTRGYRQETVDRLNTRNVIVETVMARIEQQKDA